jgi:hypothetical protein
MNAFAHPTGSSSEAGWRQGRGREPDYQLAPSGHLMMAVGKLGLPEVEQWDPELVDPKHNSGGQACVSGS